MVNMPSKSRQQQKFFGIVRKIQKGELGKNEVTSSAWNAAKRMTPREAKKYTKIKKEPLEKKSNFYILAHIKGGKNLI